MNELNGPELDTEKWLNGNCMLCIFYHNRKRKSRIFSESSVEKLMAFSLFSQMFWRHVDIARLK